MVGTNAATVLAVLHPAVVELTQLRAENAALRAKVSELTVHLDAADDAVTDLARDLEAAHTAGFTTSIWWSA